MRVAASSDNKKIKKLKLCNYSAIANLTLAFLISSFELIAHVRAEDELKSKVESRARGHTQRQYVRVGYMIQSQE